MMKLMRAGSSYLMEKVQADGKVLVENLFRNMAGKSMMEY
jgi:hypothetical protein